MKFWRNLLQLLFPKRCLGCNIQNSIGLCDECSESAPLHTNPKNHHIISAFSYKHPVVKYSLWQCKFHRDFGPLSKLLPRAHDVLLDELSERSLFNNFQNPILVPIPLHKKRQRARGFNQSEIIAYELYQRSNGTLDWNEGGLIRARETLPQAKIKERSLRFKNMKDCFEVTHPTIFHNKNIILVDDITTTGATLEEAIRVLKQAGARNVYAFTIAQ